MPYHKDIEKSREDTATCSKESYDRDPKSGKKLTARSKMAYHKDVGKSCEETATRSKDFYDKDVEKSREDTVT